MSQWYTQATEELRAVRHAIAAGAALDLSAMERTAQGITQSLLADDALVSEALSASDSDPIVSNLVHVGIFATKLGVGLNLYGDELNRLTLAGLLHDIGIFTLPPSLLSKNGKLTHDERAVLERHPIAGHDLVAALGSDYHWLAQVIRHSHERWGGQGYPDHLQGRAIHEFAHVIGICDIFDALISPRPYRTPLAPHEAVHELIQKERAAFPREVLKALVEQISVYPLGTQVRLNTGEMGTVIRLNPRFPLRPVVRLKEISIRPGMTSAIQDLSAIPTLYVTGTVKASQVPAAKLYVVQPEPAPVAAPAPQGPMSTTSSSASIVPAVPSDNAQPAMSPQETAQPESSTSTTHKTESVYSDEFAALFESLDEIAMAIQEAVKVQSFSSQPPSRSSSAGDADALHRPDNAAA